MESPWKKVVGEAGDGERDESSESMVVQCTASGDVEEGEEVARGDTTDRYGSVRGALSVALKAYGDQEELVGKKKQMGNETQMTNCAFNEHKNKVKANACEAADDVVSESEDVLIVHSMDRSLGCRKTVVAPRMATFQYEGGYWRIGVKKGRCRARKSFIRGPIGAGDSFVVDRTPIKRKHEEAKECSRGLKAACHEHTDGGDDSASSSSDFDASESESAQWIRTVTSNKRRRGENNLKRKVPWRFESLQLRPPRPSSTAEESIASQVQEEPAEYDDELKEMQQLLELQLQASEKREAGMKHRMEMMIEMLSQHMGHVEKRVGNLEGGTQPQEQVLERINVKLEQVMEGFTELNENLAILSACLSRKLESQ